MKRSRIFVIYLVALGLILFPKIVNLFYEKNDDITFSIALGLLTLILLTILILLTETGIRCLWKKRDLYSIRKTTRNNILLFVACFLGITILCGNSINDKILESHLPKKIKLEVLSENGEANSNIWIINPSMRVLNFKDFEEIEENHFLSVDGMPVLEVEVTKAAESNIILITNAKASDIKIMFDGHSQEYKCSRNTEQQITISLLYYEGLSLRRMLEYIAVLIVISVIAWIILWAGMGFAKKAVPQLYKSGILQRKVFQSPKLIFMIFGALFSLYACMHYDMVREYLEANTMGFDAGWYWYSADVFFLGQDGFSVDSFIEITSKVPFRGYFISFFYGMIKWLFGRLLQTNPLIATFIILSFLASFLNCILLPSIYSMLNERERVKIWQIVLMNICFFVFLRGHILWPMADLLPFFFALCAVYFFLKYINWEKNILLFWNFFFLVAAVLCRQSYSVLLYVELIWLAVRLRRHKMTWKAISKAFLCVCAGIFVLGVPQIVTNYLRSYSLEYIGGSMGNYLGGQSLIEANIQFSMDTATQAWPYFLKDSLGTLMINSIYPGVEELKLLDLAYIFVSHPLEFMSFFFTKLFMAIDMRTPMIYPDTPYILVGIEGVLMLTLNAALWSSFCLVLFDKKKVSTCFNKKEVVMGSIALVFLTLPLLVMQIEWRYFIVLDFLAYYVACFSFPKWIRKASRKERIKYIVMMTALSIVFIVVSIGNYANLSWNNPGGFMF